MSDSKAFRELAQAKIALGQRFMSVSAEALLALLDELDRLREQSARYALAPCPECGGPRTHDDEHDAWCDGCWEKRA